MRYFTSDLHLGHRQIIKHDNRPFKDVYEMTECIINNINKTCSKKDDLFILGDFSWFGVAKTTEIIARLNPRITIILGNHDLKTRQLIQAGVHQVYENHFIYLKDGKDTFKFYLSHYAYYPTLWHRFKLLFNSYKGWKRYLHKRMVRTGDWLGHGHNHKQLRLIKDKQINMCINRWGYFPISEKTVIKIFKGEFDEREIRNS